MDNIKKLIISWRKESEQYMRQVEEAIGVGTPHHEMLSYASALRACARELEAELLKHEKRSGTKKLD
jgi:hypothetical protein